MSAVLTFPTKTDEIISYNPATNEEIGRVAMTSAEEVQKAVEKSREAFRNGAKLRIKNAPNS